MLPPIVQTGLDLVVEEQFAPLRGLRIGLVANAASVDCRLRHIATLIGEAKDVRLAAIFGPEHGFAGDAQDLVGVGEAIDSRYGCPIHSLYGDTVESLKPTPEQLRGLDALLIDLPDVGSRYYTFATTMLKCLEAAAENNLPVVILDRPNPLGGVAIEGPLLQGEFASFVGPHPVAIRHGMTLGELARMYIVERQLRVTSHVVRCEGWQRTHYYDETFLPWVMPSPNMPTLDTALVYPGQCLLEGTNISEGRGTTRPFELCGAPWLSGRRLAEQLNNLYIPGVLFRPVTFKPTFHKFAGVSCGGVQIHVTDRSRYQPVRTSVALLAAIRAESSEYFRWRTEPYEFVHHIPAIDLLFGSSRERRALQAGLSAEQIVGPWAEDEMAFKARRERYLLY